MTLYYQDDQVTLYHGDCREITEWLAADVLVTDPPYGVRVSSRRGDCMNPSKSKVIKDVVTGDTDTSIRDSAITTWGSRPAIVFGSWRQPRPIATRQRLIWHKLKAFPGPTRAPWYSADEEIYIIGSGFTGSPEQSVLSTDEMRTGPGGLAAIIGHPTPKPVALMETLIAKCPPGAIADPFCGSGATLIAARNLGRMAIGVEVEEKYCEVTARRLAQGCLSLGV